MNPAAVLALIGDLYSQVAALTQERDALRAELAARTQAESGTVRPATTAADGMSYSNRG